jgi:peptide/nickel transport system substrate-binding protein
VQAHIYGRTGATGNLINNPERFISKNTRGEFSVEKANQRLDEAGWKRGPDGIRVEDGKKLKLVFQTSINAPGQKTQAIVKQACQKAGIDIELKSVTASVYFSSDAANPDIARKFYADMQMYTSGVGQPPDPEGACDNSCHRKLPPRKTNGGGVMPPAGTTKRTTTSFMRPKVNLIGSSERRYSLP